MSKVLIADDSPIVVKIVEDTLRQKEFNAINVTEIIIARDGLEAFNLIAEHKDIEYIFSDINMPHIDGDELIEILSDTEKLGNIKVVFITTTEKNITYHDNPAVLGTITKPLNRQKIIDSFALLLKRYEEHQKQSDSPDITTTSSDATNKLLLIANKYVNKDTTIGRLDKEYFKSILSSYIDGSDNLVESELIDILLAVFYEYLLDKSIDAVIDKIALEHIFEHIEDGVVETKEYLFFKEKDDIDIKESDEEITKYLNSVKTIAPNTTSKAVLKDSFSSIINDIRTQEEALNPKAKRYDHTRTINFVYEYIKIIEEIDFTIVDNDIKKMTEELRLYNFYYEQIIQMSSKFSNEDYFQKIFIKYQKNYIQAKEYFDKYIKLPKEILDDVKLGKYQEMTEQFTKKYQKEFSDLMKQFLHQYEKKSYLISGYYIYNIFNTVTQKAKKSKKIREFFTQNKFENELSVKSFIPYYTKKHTLNNNARNAMVLTEKYLATQSKKDIVIISLNTAEILKIKKVAEKINRNWDVFGYNNIGLIDGYFNRKAPDILVIDYDFMATSSSNLINELRSRYKAIRKKTKVVALFSKLSSDKLQSDILDKNYDYIKKPINMHHLEQFFIFA